MSSACGTRHRRARGSCSGGLPVGVVDHVIIGNGLSCLLDLETLFSECIGQIQTDLPDRYSNLGPRFEITASGEGLNSHTAFLKIRDKLSGNSQFIGEKAL